jgi:hypothetical protein
MSNTTIPTIQISKNFGKISKIIFFQVSNTINGSFNVNLFITPSQISETKISIVNKNSKTTLYNKTYGKSPNTNTISDVATIKHDPTTKSPIYGLIVS